MSYTVYSMKVILGVRTVWILYLHCLVYLRIKLLEYWCAYVLIQVDFFFFIETVNSVIMVIKVLIGYLVLVSRCWHKAVNKKIMVFNLFVNDDFFNEISGGFLQDINFIGFLIKIKRNWLEDFSWDSPFFCV